MLKKQHSKVRLSQIAKDLEANGTGDGGSHTLSPNSVRTMVNGLRKPLGLPMMELGRRDETTGKLKLEPTATTRSSDEAKILPIPPPQLAPAKATLDHVLLPLPLPSVLTSNNTVMNQNSAGNTRIRTHTNQTMNIPQIMEPLLSEKQPPATVTEVVDQVRTLPTLLKEPESGNSTLISSRSFATATQGIDLSELRSESNVTNHNESDMSWKTTCSVSPAPGLSVEQSDSNRTDLLNSVPTSVEDCDRFNAGISHTQSTVSSITNSTVSTTNVTHASETRSYNSNNSTNHILGRPPIATAPPTVSQGSDSGLGSLGKENKTAEKSIYRTHSLSNANADTRIESKTSSTYSAGSKTYYRIPLSEESVVSNMSAEVNKKALTTGYNIYNNPDKDKVFEAAGITGIDHERPIYSCAAIVPCPPNQNNLQPNETYRKSLTARGQAGQISNEPRHSDNYSADISRKTLTNFGMSGELRSCNNTGDMTYKKQSTGTHPMFCTPVTKGTSRTLTGSSSRAPSSQKPSNANGKNEKNKQAKFWKLTTEKVCETSYLLLKQLGKGGCGEVYLVMENDSRDLHALKKVNMQQLDNVGVQECINEVQMLLALRDTELVINIVEWEVDQTNQVLKIVMEYGQCDLSKTIISRSSTLTKVKSCWENMLQIVQAIHGKGIVHGDLKPANFVWVAGRLKIIDFGIANRLQSDVTSIQTCNPKGTLNFMSPESIRPDAYGRAKIGPKSDIWSMGCILYLMVYGQAPFQGYQNQIAKMNAIINGTIEYPPLPLHLNDSKILDVLKLCFQLDSRHRPDATALLRHPFLTA